MVKRSYNHLFWVSWSVLSLSRERERELTKPSKGYSFQKAKLIFDTSGRFTRLKTILFGHKVVFNSWTLI